MLKDLFRIDRVIISNATRLYPKGLDWELRPGVNVVAGGTGLGKTTFIHAMLFGLFGPLGRSSKRFVEKVDSNYFVGRVCSAEEAIESENAASVEVHATFAKTAVHVIRTLTTGRIQQATFNNEIVPHGQYESRLAQTLGVDNYEDELLRLVDHLLYVSENPHLLAWDSQTQNEIMTILFGESADFAALSAAWSDVTRADSEFRNARYQAHRIEKQIADQASKTSPESAEGIASKRVEYESATKRAEAARNAAVKRWQETRDLVENFQR